MSVLRKALRRLGDALYRLRALVGGGDMDRDLDEEMAFHLEMEERKLVAEGVDPAEARRLARIRFGGVERQREHARTSRGVSPLLDLADDVAYGLRQLRRRPAFAVAAILTLGLGLGGTVALGSAAHGLLVSPLPFAEEDRLHAFWLPYWWSVEEVDFLQERIRRFDALAAHSNEARTLRTPDGTRLLTVSIATGNLFDVLGASPLLGRALVPGDGQPGSEEVIVLSHGLWEREFGADPEVVGRRITVDGTPTTVVGVMERTFWFPTPAFDAWQPLDMDPAGPRYSSGWLQIVARDEPGLDAAGRRDEVAGLARQLAERFDYPAAADKTREAAVTPLRDHLLGDVGPAVTLLVAAVALLLLMACTNVTALVLTRNASRIGEMSIRAALGAGRGRLARQVLTESLVLGALAGLLGVGVAWISFDALVAALPLAPGLADTLTLDGRTLAGAVVLSLAAGALVSLAPVRSVLRGQASTDSMRDRSGGPSRRDARIRHGLVVVEVALAVVLVTGAALLTRSVRELRSVDAGLDPAGVLTSGFYMGPQDAGPEERDRFYRELPERVAALPAVEAAGFINRLPVRDGGYQGSVDIPDRPELSGENRVSAYWRAVQPGALRALGVEPVEGRLPTEADRQGSVRVVVVNRALAEAFWPGRSALGRTFATNYRAGRSWEVVGVVPDVAVQGLTGRPGPVGYHPWAQAETGATAGVLVVKTATGEPEALAPAIRALARELDPRAAVGTVATMDDVLDGAMRAELRLRFFLSLFSALGLVLGAVGIYGVVAYAVEERRSEFGLRRALGAASGQLLGHVVRVGMVPVVVGVAVGLVAALATASALGGFLYEVAPVDPLSFAAAAGVLLAAGIGAALVPAARAARADPGAVLRSD